MSDAAYLLLDLISERTVVVRSSAYAGRRYLSLDSLAPLRDERREHDEDEEVLALTAA